MSVLFADTAPELARFQILVEAIVWPATLLLVALIAYFLAKSLVRNVAEAKRKDRPPVPSFALNSYNAHKMLASAHFAAAVVAMRYEKRRDGDNPYDFTRIDKLLKHFIRIVRDDEKLKRLASICILWAHKDDAHDQFEQRAFAALGICDVRFVLSTDEAVEQYKTGRYNLVISNMAHYRDGGHIMVDEEAGFNLLDRLEAFQKPLTAPFILYSRRLNPDRIARAAERGVTATHEPDRLFDAVFDSMDKAVSTEPLTPPPSNAIVGTA